jgi:hypothetical protein
MCVSCQMSLLEDHQTMAGELCECGNFRFDPSSGSDCCYHCFCKKSGCEDPHNCPVCAPEIPSVFYDLDMTDELEMVIAARAIEGRRGNG